MNPVFLELLVIIPPLFVAGYFYRSSRCWTVLALTLLVAPVASVMNLAFSTLGDMSLYDPIFERVLFPSMMLVLPLFDIANRDTLWTILFWAPAIQTLLYGIISAIAAHKHRLLRAVAAILLVHGLLVVLAYITGSKSL